jgi:carbonic anhydrase
MDGTAGGIQGWPGAVAHIGCPLAVASAKVDPMTVDDPKTARASTPVAGADGLPKVPARRVAVVTCMDARVDPLPALDLGLGDAHVIRNAGAMVTDDVLRSLAISQAFLGTRAVVVMAHTDCGLCGLDEDAFRDGLAARAGEQPPWSAGSFVDVDTFVTEGAQRVRTCPFLRHTAAVSAVVFDVATRRVRPAASGNAGR